MSTTPTIHVKVNDGVVQHFSLAEVPNLMTLAQKMNTVYRHSAFINGKPANGFEEITFGTEEMFVHFKDTSFDGETWNGDPSLDDPRELQPPPNS